MINAQEAETSSSSVWRQRCCRFQAHDASHSRALALKDDIYQTDINIDRQIFER